MAAQLRTASGSAGERTLVVTGRLDGRAARGVRVKVALLVVLAVQLTACFTPRAVALIAAGDSARGFAFELQEAATAHHGGELWLYGRDVASQPGRPVYATIALPGNTTRIRVPWSRWMEAREPLRPLPVEHAGARSEGASPCSFLGFFHSQSTALRVLSRDGTQRENAASPQSTVEGPVLYRSAPLIRPAGSSLESAPVQLVLEGLEGDPRLEFVFLEKPASSEPSAWALLGPAILLDAIFVPLLPVTLPLMGISLASQREATTDPLALEYGRTHGCACVERGRSYGEIWIDNECYLPIP